MGYEIGVKRGWLEKLVILRRGNRSALRQLPAGRLSLLSAPESPPLSRGIKFRERKRKRDGPTGYPLDYA
jgi:hypothetical protein